jgi:hypothetical protein
MRNCLAEFGDGCGHARLTSSIYFILVRRKSAYRPCDGTKIDGVGSVRYLFLIGMRWGVFTFFRVENDVKPSEQI